jgi:hypothetical protein
MYPTLDAVQAIIEERTRSYRAAKSRRVEVER